MCITEETQRHPRCHCHGNSLATGAVLIKTKIPSFCLNQEPSTPRSLLMGVKTIWELCLFQVAPFFSGAFHSTKNSRNSGLGSEWNRRFLEFHSEILGVPREVGPKFRRIGITGKFRSIRPFLLVPSFSEPGNQHG